MILVVFCNNKSIKVHGTLQSSTSTMNVQSILLSTKQVNLVVNCIKKNYKVVHYNRFKILYINFI